MGKLDKIKRYLGIVWMLAGPVIVGVLVKSAITHINPKLPGDIHQPLPWIIIIAIFTPVAIGLTIFGWYAWRGEYDGRPSERG